MIAALCFGIIYLYLTIAVFIPYFRLDQAQYWDMPVHLFAAWFIRNFTFPNYTGWNPFFFAGYPHDVFYGPVYHYIVAALGFTVNLIVAQKVINIVVIAALPLAIYYFARKYCFNKNESSLMTLLAMLPVASLNLACGGTLYSLFNVGLAPNALAIIFYFIYVGKFKEVSEQFKTGQEKSGGANIVPLTALAVLLVLTHFVVALAAVLAGLIIISTSFNPALFKFSLKHLLLTFLCAAFFLVPLLANTGQFSDNATILSMGFFMTIPTFLLILLGGAAAVLDKDKRFDAGFYMTIAAFAIIIFIDFGQFGLPMDAYRFIIFFIIPAMFLPAKMLLNNLDNKLLKGSLILLFIILLSIQVRSLINPGGRAQLNRNQIFIYQDSNKPYQLPLVLPKLDGRVVVYELSHRRAPHPLRHFLAMQGDNWFIKGTFAESSVNARPSLRLYNKIIGLFSSGSKGSNEAKAQWLNLNKLVNLFQVNYFFSEIPIKGREALARINVRTDREPYYLYKINNAKLIELLAYKPLAVKRNWDHWKELWWNNLEPRILVKTEKLPDEIAASSDKIENVRYQGQPAQLSFFVRAEKPVPVLVKMAYFPRWHAYENGQRIRIYEVAPSLMLVYAKGEVALKYERNLVDYLGWLLTLVGIGILIYGLAKIRESALTD